MDCSRFKCNNLLFAECCQDYFCCWVCHKKEKNHVLYTIPHVKCRKCDTINDLTNECIKCHIKFNDNFCEKCVIWHNFKNTFHCDKCDACFNGKKSEFYHCPKCDICILQKVLSSHKCEIINDKDENCPLCTDNLYKNKRNNFILKCGHIMHRECFKEYKSNYKDLDKIFKCLICYKSINELADDEKKFDNLKFNYSIHIDKISWKTKYSCYDCKVTNVTSYHPKYIKCINCKSYNTSSIEVYKQ